MGARRKGWQTGRGTGVIDQVDSVRGTGHVGHGIDGDGLEVAGDQPTEDREDVGAGGIAVRPRKWQRGRWTGSRTVRRKKRSRADIVGNHQRALT